jgi:vitamin B12 transporter
MLAPIFLAVLATPPTAVPPQSVTHPPPPAVEAAIQAPKLPWPPPGVLRTGTGIVSPRLISEVKPNYTPEAMRAGIEGAVHMDVVVRADGRVGDVQVIGPLDPGLDAEAVRAVRQWQFEPGRRGGVAVPVLVEIEMTFTMRDQPGEPSAARSMPVAEPAPSTPWPPAGVLRTGPGITSPRLLRETKPNYTGAAMRAGIQGTIWLEAVVDTEAGSARCG